MKTEIFRAEDRGQADHGWLKVRHAFSFANYYNPERINYGALRVLNDDSIAPSMGFGMHPHDNMEIITIPLSGTLKHRDSQNGAWQELQSGEIQVMSAGTGIVHSEMNATTKEWLHLFQIWILPNAKNVVPAYAQKSFDPAERQGQLQVLVSAVGADKHPNSLKIHQDAQIARIDLEAGADFAYTPLSEQHGVYVLVIDGSIEVQGHSLEKRDAIGLSHTESFELKATSKTELLFIEVPMF